MTAEVKLSSSYLRSNKRRLVLEICADLSRVKESLSVQDIMIQQEDDKYRSRYPYLLYLSEQQAAQIMAGAPYLIKAGHWQRSKQYIFDERYRTCVIPGRMFKRSDGSL
ncbi:MAG: hypothetical protein WC375_06510 [Methanomassiliicoccales archaeon]|jgi:hypothetical protein